MAKGYKTYIVAALLAAVTFGESIGVLPGGLADQLQVVLAATGLATLRSAVANS